MLRVEIHKLFIKNKILIALLILFVLTAFFSLSFNISDKQIKYSSGEFSCGNAVFLHNDNVNWLIVAFIIFANLIVWIGEYKSNMQIYNLTGKKGGARLAIIKINVLIITVAFAVLSADFISLIVYDFKFGSKNLPLSSCGADYETTAREITSLAAVGLSALFHAAGYVFFAVKCSFIANIFKSALSFMGGAISLIVIPVYLIEDISARIRFPFSVSLMQSATFFRGSILNAGEEAEFLFKELTDNEIVTNFLIQLLIALILAVVSIILFSGKKITVKKRLVVFSAIPFLICGCSDGLSAAENGEYFAIPNTDLVYSIKDDRIFSVNPTPLTGRNLVQISGKYALVWENCDDNYSTYQIKAIDLNDLSERTLLTIGKSVNKNGFLGLDDLIKIPDGLLWDENFKLSRDFRFDSNKLYFFDETQIIVYDINNGSRAEIDVNGSYSDPLISNGDIYYIDNDNKLCKNFTRVCPLDVSQYIVQNDTIVISCKDDNKIYRIVSDKCEQVSQSEADYFLYCDSEKIVFVSGNSTVSICDANEIEFDFFGIYADSKCIYEMNDDVIKAHSY